MSGGGRVPLDLSALRGELAASPDAGRLQPIGLGRVIDGNGALDQLAGAVAQFPGARDGVVVLAAATPMTVSGQDLRSVVEAALGHAYCGSGGSPLSGRRRRRAGNCRPESTRHAGGQLHADEATVAAAAGAAAGAELCGDRRVNRDDHRYRQGRGRGLSHAPGRRDRPPPASVRLRVDPFSVLLRQGVKRTTPTRWPDTLLVIDPAVLSGAPPELNWAGGR